jgi:hypothetical protein
MQKLMGTLGGRLWRSTGPGADALLWLDMDPGTRGQRLQVGETLRDISVVAEGKMASEHLAGWGSRVKVTRV